MRHVAGAIRRASGASAQVSAARHLTRVAGRHLFGADPRAYAAGRPGYPEAVFRILTARCGLRPGTATLEIGPGAGQATERLLELGAHPLVAVEPDRSFAAYLAERFGGRVDVRAAPFEEAGLAAASFDLAASATSFHWVERDRGAALVAHVLRPGGWWTAWWTIFHDPARMDPLFAALAPILRDLPRQQGAEGRNGPAAAFALDRDARAADLRATGAFDSVEVEEIRWQLELDGARARALFGTFSPILALPAARREAVLAAVERVVEDDFGGRAERSAVTILYTAQRR